MGTLRPPEPDRRPYAESNFLGRRTWAATGPATREPDAVRRVGLSRDRRVPGVPPDGYGRAADRDLGRPATPLRQVLGRPSGWGRAPVPGAGSAGRGVDVRARKRPVVLGGPSPRRRGRSRPALAQARGLRAPVGPRARGPSLRGGCAKEGWHDRSARHRRRRVVPHAVPVVRRRAGLVGSRPRIPLSPLGRSSRRQPTRR